LQIAWQEKDDESLNHQLPVSHKHSNNFLQIIRSLIMANEKLTKVIQEIYLTSKKPVLLSFLGSKLRDDFPFEGKLAQIIEEKVDGFSVIHNEKRPERIAITTPEDEDLVRKFIEEGIDLFREEKETLRTLKKLPRSLVYAFCKESDDDIYISKIPPFKFKVNPSSTDNNDLLIDKQYRSNVLYKKNLNSIPEDELEKLLTNINQWANDKQINLALFNMADIEKTTMQQRDNNLLEAILSAVPQRSHNRITLPLDIIAILRNTKI